MCLLSLGCRVCHLSLGERAFAIYSLGKRALGKRLPSLFGEACVAILVWGRECAILVWGNVFANVVRGNVRVPS